MNIIDNIHSRYSKFSKTQKKIADFIISNPYKACFLSLKQFSNEVSVTETTIINFAKKLNFNSFIQFKNELQLYVKNLVSPPDKLLNALKNENLNDNDLSSIINTEIAEFKRTMSDIKEEDVKNVVEILKNATKIYVLGVGISQVVVRFLLLRIRLLGLDVEEFEISTYNVFSLQLLKIKPTDAFIIISFPQYSKLAALTVDYLNQNKCKMISITKSAASPLAKYSQVIFTCYCDSLIFYNSMTSPMAVANTLVTALAIDMKDKLVKNIEKIKEVEESFLKEGFYKE